ncbi:MAG: glycosyltransferase [Bacteroidia bacterium]|nr:glycosyltransferase [Bacteroidia bacterium]
MADKKHKQLPKGKTTGFHLVSIGTFSGLPLVKYIFDLFHSLGETHVVQCTMGNFHNYLQQANTHQTVLHFPTNKEFNSQGTSHKIKKYLKVFSNVLFDGSTRACYYTIDLFTLALLIFLKKVRVKRNAVIVYHQFELIEPQQLNRLDSFFLKYISKNLKQLNLAVFPEENRMNYFKSLVNTPDDTDYLLIPNSNDNDFGNTQQPGSGKTVVGHIGAVGLGHYIHSFMEAVKDLPQDQYDVLFIGSLQQEVIDLISGYNLTNVKLIGQIPHNELSSYYETIDIGVILYKDIGLNYRFCAPNKLYEYWSHGIPVVAHELPGLTSVFADPMEGKLVDMTEPSTIVQALMNQSVSVDNRKALNEMFKRKHHIAQYLELLKQRLQIEHE